MEATSEHPKVSRMEQARGTTVGLTQLQPKVLGKSSRVSQLPESTVCFHHWPVARASAVSEPLGPVCCAPGAATAPQEAQSWPVSSASPKDHSPGHTKQRVLSMGRVPQLPGASLQAEAWVQRLRMQVADLLLKLGREEGVSEPSAESAHTTG